MRNLYLLGVVMNDVDIKSCLLVYIILGVGDYVKVKIESVLKIGEFG